MVEYRIGDLFAQPDLPALGQGVNCSGVMGAGIAKEFRRRWPDMYADYRRTCLAGNLRPGGVHWWVNVNGPATINLATQDQPGPHATLEAVRDSLARAVGFGEDDQLSAFGIPQIGCGIGGLRWDDVRGVIEDVAGSSPVRVVVVSRP